MTTQIKANIDSVLVKHNLTVESVFIPWSQSRNKNEKNPSLNWKVTLKQGNRKILTTDYMAGCGHAPSYKQEFGKRDLYREATVKKECETGFACTYGYSLDFIHVNKKNPILPNQKDVIYSLLMDSDVLEYPSFESWAESFGYDSDSRSSEKIYKSCLEIALQFRQVGESVIAELRDAYQDY